LKHSLLSLLIKAMTAKDSDAFKASAALFKAVAAKDAAAVAMHAKNLADHSPSWDNTGQPHSNLFKAMTAAVKKGFAPSVGALMPHLPGGELGAYLIEAVQAKRLAVLEKLLTSPRINPDYCDGEAFEEAIAQENQAMVEVLSKHVVSRPSYFSRAIETGNLPILTLVMGTHKARANHCLALQFACMQRAPFAVQALWATGHPLKAARELAQYALSAQEAAGGLASPEAQESWRALDYLSTVAPAKQATIWVKAYGVNHFPQLMAQHRAAEALKQPVPEPVRPRQRQRP
jgi:hypothetical protein